MTRPTLTASFQLAVRAAAAASMAVVVARILGFQSPLYAVISAVFVMDLSPAQTRQLAVPRLGGTLLGAVMGAVLSQFLRPGPFAAGFGVLLAMLTCGVLRLQDAARIAGYVCGVIVLTHSDRPWSHAFDRLIETTLGIAMAVLVSFVPKLNRLDAARDR
jgi:uncharacterized membrane protein YgaE (UPF0421/DUF939 family)